MQFTNTSDATLQTDTKQHNAGGELHATLLNNEPYRHTRPHPMGGRRGADQRCKASPRDPEGLAGQRVGAPPHTALQAPPVWRAPEGPEGQGGPRDRPLRAAGSRVAISRAGRRPPAHTAARARQRGGYRSTRPFSTHSATASSRLRPNGCQSWRRRRIHRNMPPTTAAPRPAPPIRPSKPVRARPFFGLVAGTSGAT